MSMVTRLQLGAVLGLGLLAVGCGGGGDASTPGNSDNSSDPDAPVSVAPPGTSGNDSSGCSVRWNTESLLTSAGATNDGFEVSVHPGFGDPGYLLAQHFYVGNDIHWRIPVGTTYPIDNAVLVVTFEPAGGTWTYDPAGSADFFNNRQHIFYETAVYAYDAPAAPPTVDQRGRYTFQLGSLEANTGVAFQLIGPTYGDLGTSGPYVAKMELRGSYRTGQPRTCMIDG